MMTSSDLFTHIFLKSRIPQDHVVLVLHGTGGDEYDLIPLTKQLFPDSNILSLRGTVHEQGMNRFFMRYPDGTFDQQSIKDQTQNLTTFLEKASIDYTFSIENITVLGYSNGANFALSHMFYYPGILRKAILLHPTIPFEPRALNLTNTKIIVTTGKHDEYTSTTQKTKLKAILENAHTILHWFEHNGGHELRQEEFQFIEAHQL